MSALYDMREYITWDLASPTFAYCINELTRYKPRKWFMYDFRMACAMLKNDFTKAYKENPYKLCDLNPYFKYINTITETVNTYIFNANKIREGKNGIRLLHEKYWAQHAAYYWTVPEITDARRKYKDIIEELNGPINRIILQNLLEYPRFIYISYADWLSDQSRLATFRPGYKVMTTFEKNLI